MSRSCYVLEFSVLPGGARRAELFCYREPAHIRRCLEQAVFSNDPGRRTYEAHLALHYGETLALWVIQRGRVTQGIDLHAYLQASVEGSPWVPLSDAAAGRALMAPHLEADFNALRVAFRLDWDTLVARIPALEGEPMAPGDEPLDFEADPALLERFASCLARARPLSYGYTSRETEPDPGFEDPDPAPEDE